MSTYKISFEQLRQKPPMGELLNALERGFAKFNIDFYLVGALARDTWMGMNNVRAKRATTDVDLAIFINNADTYDALKEYLVDTEGFSSRRENAFVLVWTDGTEVDLMPFGDIEDNGKVKVQGTGFTTIHVDGFKEVYEQKMPEVEWESGNKFKVCTLQGIVLLKLIAWEDRPEMRRDDILDISDILQHYWNINSEEILNEHNDIFLNEKNGKDEAAAIVLGRKMGTILLRNEKIAERVVNILTANTTSPEKSRIGAIMTEYYKENTVADNIVLLKHVLNGMQERIKGTEK